VRQGLAQARQADDAEHEALSHHFVGVDHGWR
jgi:hypothetical protein